MVKTITVDNYEQEAVKTDKTVVLDFWASWCAPCRMFAPIIEQFAEEHPEVVVGKVNIDEQPQLTQQFKVMSVPTLVIMKNGEEVRKSTGVITKSEIEALL